MAEEREKEAAQKRLKEAMASGDVSQLREALSPARRLCGETKAVQEARELLQKLELKIKAQENLAKAVADVKAMAVPKATVALQCLQEALRAAEEADLAMEDLAEGRHLLETELRKSEAERLEQHISALKNLLTQAALDGVKDAVNRFASYASVDKAATVTAYPWDSLGLSQRIQDPSQAQQDASGARATQVSGGCGAVWRDEMFCGFWTAFGGRASGQTDRHRDQ